MRRVRKSESSLTRLFVYAKKISRGIHATDWLQLSDWGLAAKCIFHLKLGSREEPLPRRLVSIFENMTKKDAFIEKNVYKLKWCVVVKADNDDDDATDVRIETLAYSISGCLLSPPLLVSKEIAATDIWASNIRAVQDKLSYIVKKGDNFQAIQARKFKLSKIIFFIIKNNAYGY